MGRGDGAPFREGGGSLRAVASRRAAAAGLYANNLSSPEKFTLSLGLATFNSQYGSFPSQLMAVTTIMTLPILLLFFLTQRTFIQGMTTSGIKG